MGIQTNNSDIITISDFNPSFNWQVGFSTPESKVDNLTFRATIRPLTYLEANSRIPSPVVLYEETGILLGSSDNLGHYQFTLSKNASAVNGPYRDFQLVIEAHDSNGNTSAGNQVGTTGENGWSAYPFGYDILVVSNPRFTGAELSQSVPTQNTSISLYNTVSGQYKSQQFSDSHGNVTINYTSGYFNSGLVGGYLYMSTIPFNKTDIFDSGSLYYPYIQRTRFDFNPTNPKIHIPTAVFNTRGAPFNYGSISFYDLLDSILIANNHEIVSGLYVSNNALFYNDSSAGSLTLGSAATLAMVQVTGYPTVNTAYTSGIIGSGVEIARTSTSGRVNQPGNITTIFYMTNPLTGLGYTGISISNQNYMTAGVGGSAINNNTYIPYGGVIGDTIIVTGLSADGFSYSGCRASDLRVGQYVRCWAFNYGAGVGAEPYITGKSYNPTGDNWKQSINSVTPYFSSFNSISGKIMNIQTRTVNNYAKITLSNAYRHTLGPDNYFGYISVDANQPLLCTDSALLNNNVPDIPTGTFFRQASQTLTGYYSSWNYDLSLGDRFSGVSIINTPTTIYSFEIQPYNTYMIIPTGVFDDDYFTFQVVYSHDSVFTAQQLYNY